MSASSATGQPRYGQGSMEMHMHLNPCDSLLAKIYREFQKGLPTVIPVEKVKSSFVAMRPQEERSTPMGKGVSMHFHEESTPKVRMVVDYYWCLRILAYAVAKAGNFEFDRIDPDDEAKTKRKALYAPLDVNLNYADEALRQALEHKMDIEAATWWLRSRDLQTRGVMVGLMRAGLPQGIALKRALDATQLQWATGPTNKGRKNIFLKNVFKNVGKNI